MHKDYWLERWATNNTRFDERVPHRYLVKYFPKIHPPSQKKVFVPLCGKSIDMTWLLNNGYHVGGVELSELAIKRFFHAQNMTYDIVSQAPYKRFNTDNLSILCGDFFKLTKEILCDYNLFYDRGAFIAMPPGNLRDAYIQHLNDYYPVDAKILMVTHQLNQDEMRGPPFTVNTELLYNAFGKKYSIELLEEQEILEIKPHWIERGLKKLYESAYLLMKKS